MKAVERALGGLAQLFRLSRMYPDNHPAVASALKDLSAALPGLTESGVVECRVKPQGWSVGNAPVLARNPALTQLAQLLYSRGARAVGFHPGVRLENMQALLRVATGHLGPDDPALGVVDVGKSARRTQTVQAPGPASPKGGFTGDPFRAVRTTGVFRPDALPPDIEARRLLPPFAVGGDPVERVRAVKRLAGLAPEVRALRDPALTAEILAAMERCISDAHDVDLAAQARDVAGALVDDGLLAQMVRRLGDPRLPDGERDHLIHGLAAVIEPAGGVMADAYLGASPDGRAAYLAVMRAAGERAVFPVLKRLTGSGADIAAAAADLLGATASATAYERLSRATRDDSPLVRERALRAMTEIGGGDLTRAAATLLRDPVAPVRAAAAHAVGSVSEPTGAALLIARLGAESDEDVLVELLWALGRTGDASVVDAVAGYARAGGALTKRPRRVRIAAAQALATAGTPAARAILQELADDPEPEVRAAATGASS